SVACVRHAAETFDFVCCRHRRRERSARLGFPGQPGQAPDKKIGADINTDMPLTFVPINDFVAQGMQHSSLGPLARQAATAQGYRLSADANPEQLKFIRSDQFSFIQRGIPAIALNGGYEARNPSTDLAEMRQQFLGTHYHQPSDDLTLPMDYPTAADLARINLRIALNVANAPSLPRWNNGD